MTRQRRRRLIKTRRTVTGLMLVASISFLAGMTDAVGLMLTGNFVSFMTGNTTRAAIALGTGDFGHAAVLFSAILTFIAGNALGIVIAHAADRRAFVVLACVSALLAAAAGFAEPPLILVQFYLVVLAMGLVNATVEHIEGLPIGLTYVTGALSRFGRGVGRFLLGDRDFAWTVQIVPWSGMIVGAVIGALLANALGAHALWLVSMVALVLALATLFIPRPLQRRFSQRLMMAAPMARRSK
ncbi:YoaK family protein [Rhizobium sp. SYY.PMSO]|uniref:YoaK family protein n=1 Tax=Rhizobium sp. SYY.PMSO TaxID=3382192 RepID=UPI000DD56408